MSLTIKAIKIFIVVLAIIYIPLAFSLWEYNPAQWPTSARVASVFLFLIAIAVMMIIGAVNMAVKADEARTKSYDEYVATHRKKGGFQKMLDEQLAKASAGRAEN